MSDAPNVLETYANQYFTGAQASIFIGDDIWVDECFGIQFSASQSILPIYGYASTYFDAVARGKVLVQGVFEINFVDEGYLYSVLEEKYKNAGLDSDVDTKESRLQEQLDILKAIDSKTVRDQSRMKTMSNILNDIASMDYTSIDKVATNINKKSSGRVNSDSDMGYNNVIYKMYRFDLQGYFGNPQIFGTDQGTYKRLRNCFLVGNEMIIGGGTIDHAAGDEIIKERYSFIAQDHI